VRYPVKFEVNGVAREAAVEAHTTLLTLLRDHLDLTGTKLGCATGDCGACTVIMDGRPVTSCMVLALDAGGRRVVTIEGLAEDGRLHPLQQAFVEHGAVQCGYCTPGVIMMAKALLDENAHPSEQEVRSALQGNLCRCTGYNKIVGAVLAAAGRSA
jgi:carbon-monoxide dehydrogenase small subunit